MSLLYILHSEPRQLPRGDSKSCENKYQLSIFTIQMKWNKSPSCGNGCPVNLIHAYYARKRYDNTPDEHSVHPIFDRLKGLSHWFSNAIQFNSLRKKTKTYTLRSILKMAKPTMEYYIPDQGKHRCPEQKEKKICDEKEDKPQLIGALTEVQNI